MMDDEDEETETDAIVNQVLDEIGISLTQEVTWLTFSFGSN